MGRLNYARTSRAFARRGRCAYLKGGPDAPSSRGSPSADHAAYPGPGARVIPVPVLDRIPDATATACAWHPLMVGALRSPRLGFWRGCLRDFVGFPQRNTLAGLEGSYKPHALHSPT